MLPSHTLSLTIMRHWLDLYETVWKPEFFPKWVSAIGDAPLQPEGNIWKARGADGVIKVRFTEHNAFGVMDHWLDNGFGKEIYMPMRIVPNQEGAQVLLTLFRQPFTSDEKFRQELATIEQDLQKLHQLVTH
ncbi:polyketide cyclase [Mixta gaviniae]|uniref:Polyketide cyclase n=1 Tax=Mixta gaviniae TaxID=665914 RepID=A0A1X1EDX0_9GAMM|nr:polyketide cyclase [Mixta gaviniae]AUX95273.1 polyketide cyclase [Mixta gaviniae]ORM87116.1 polyketide cyclase [Mixta gaviniae]